MLKKQERLVGVDPRLVAVVLAACKSVPFDVQLVEGVRTKARQAELYAQGRTAPGRVVTWTMDSKHIPNAATGFGMAVDIVPLQSDGTINWNDKRGFQQLASAMIEAGLGLKTRVRNGGDWDQDGVFGEKGENDFPHWELT